MDDLAWLRLQVEWGADEALDELPVDRRTAAGPCAAARAAPCRRLARVPAGPRAGPGAGACRGGRDVPALQAALAGFEGCALRATATNLVFADGDPASRLVLVADVPGAAEDRAGLPFAGPAGLFLDRMFASAGLDRAAWRSISLLPWRPAGRPQADGERGAALPAIPLPAPALAAPRAGGAAGRPGRADAAAGRPAARGVWHDLAIPGLDAPVPTLAWPSPAHIQATPPAKRDAWADLLRLRRVLAATSGITVSLRFKRSGTARYFRPGLTRPSHRTCCMRVACV